MMMKEILEKIIRAWNYFQRYQVRVRESIGIGY